MIGQYDDSIDFEWIFLLRLFESAPQSVDMFDKESLPPILLIMREKPASTGNKGASVIWHVESITCIQRKRRITPRYAG
jgi:hypothetical protein